MAKYFASPASLARIATIILGIVVLGLGLYSHFQSFWTKEQQDSDLSGEKVYIFCKILEEGDSHEFRDMPCPSISKEHYYVSMIVICFILSLVGLIASFLMDLSSQPMKFVDLGYHAVAAFLLLIAAIVYIVSANQIHKIFAALTHDSDHEQLALEARLGAKELRVEKIAAGALTIVLALVYGVTAFLIAIQRQEAVQVVPERSNI